MMYASDFDEKLPSTQAGNNPVNVVHGGYYTRWIGVWNVERYKVPKSWVQPQALIASRPFDSLGLLYPQKLSGDGKIYYCSSLNSKQSPIGSANYEPLLTTDAANTVTGSTGGNVRGSYIYNPWVANPAGGSDVDHLRIFTKTSRIDKRRVFGMDFIDSDSWLAGGEVDVNGRNFAHSRDKGWNVIFTDNSIEFKKVGPATKKVYTLGGFRGGQYDIQGICDLARLVFE